MQRHRAGRRWFTVFFLPVIPLNRVGEHVQCSTCRTRYVTEVLSQPTTARHSVGGSLCSPKDGPLSPHPFIPRHPQ